MMGCWGARAIKEADGAVMIQDKETSVVWGMPGSVHASGAFDKMGSLQDCRESFTSLDDELIKDFIFSSIQGVDVMSLSSEQLKFFADYIEQKLGIIYAKENYYQLERRLTDIAGTLGLSSPGELWQKAQTGIFGQMQSLLLDQATNNETSFFRRPGLI
jgi:hypothetical protein